MIRPTGYSVRVAEWVMYANGLESQLAEARSRIEELNTALAGALAMLRVQTAIVESHRAPTDEGPTDAEA